MLTKIPAFRNAKPAKHWPPEGNRDGKGDTVRNEEGPPPAGEGETPCFPLLIFSHGLGGTRTTYSSLCGEFASYGFIVCAIEHRDGSGPRTYVNHPKTDKDSMEDEQDEGNVDHTPEQLKKHYDKIDYIFPKDNHRDTAPRNKKGVDQKLRSAQLQLRLAEIEAAYRVLTTICEGKGEEIAESNLRRKGYKASSSRGLEGVDWAAWKDLFHLDKVTMLGHSFGAATTIEVLRNAERFNYISQGVIYDIWSAAIKPKDGEDRRLSSPLLGINSEAFMYWQTNFDTALSLVEEVKSSPHESGEIESIGTPAWLLTIRGTVHVSQCDFTILYPHICTFLLKMTANPKRAIDLNVGATLEFLKSVMKDRSAIIRRTMRDEDILDVPVLEKVPSERRPAGKWTAVRLKIPHEFRQRVLPKLERKLKRKSNVSSSPVDEVWMHVTTGKEEVVRWEAERAMSKLREEGAVEGIEVRDMEERDNGSVNRDL